jgi:prophage DNA circulation protein
MPVAPWRAALQPASFKGAIFFVDIDEKGGGRRLVPHEFPKRDVPYTEDMGRRARRYTIQAYIVSGAENGFDYRPLRDALVLQLEAEGPGPLVHPTMGTDTVEVDTFRVTERRELGGYVEFEMQFIEAGSQISTTPITDTVTAAIAAATSAIAAFAQSSDITGLVGP